MTPVLPSQFKTTTEEPGDSVGRLIYKLFLLFPIYFYRWYRSVYNLDGSFTAEYKAMVCEVIQKCRDDAASDADNEETA